MKKTNEIAAVRKPKVVQPDVGTEVRTVNGKLTAVMATEQMVMNKMTSAVKVTW
jgi:hypothetical protein